MDLIDSHEMACSGTAIDILQGIEGRDCDIGRNIKRHRDIEIYSLMYMIKDK